MPTNNGTNYSLDRLRKKVQETFISDLKDYLLDKPSRSSVSRSELQEMVDSFGGRIARLPPAKRRRNQSGLNLYSFTPVSQRVAKRGALPTGQIVEHMEVACST